MPTSTGTYCYIPLYIWRAIYFGTTRRTLSEPNLEASTSLSYTESLPTVLGYIAAISIRTPRLSFNRTVVATLARLGASSSERVSPLVVSYFFDLIEENFSTFNPVTYTHNWQTHILLPTHLRPPPHAHILVEFLSVVRRSVRLGLVPEELLPVHRSRHLVPHSSLARNDIRTFEKLSNWCLSAFNFFESGVWLRVESGEVYLSTVRSGLVPGSGSELRYVCSWGWGLAVAVGSAR